MHSPEKPHQPQTADGTPQGILMENERLRSSWNSLPLSHLATYLSSSEQDQRINAHSILTRALLVDTLWPGKFDILINEELRFGVVMTWLLEEVRSGTDRSRLLDDLNGTGSGRPVPDIVRDTFAWLQTEGCPFHDYVSDALRFEPSGIPGSFLFEPALDTFRWLWSSELSGLSPDVAGRISVLEVACGSGNEYRALRDFGLAEHIEYAGLDISWKNISNARSFFPGVNFFEASILNSGLSDRSYDYVFVHDLIGHLSPQGMEIALSEILRIARTEAWINCFHAVDIERHEIRPFQQYFKNRLSICQVKASLEKAGASVDVFRVHDMLMEKFGFAQDYSLTSVTFVARKT